MEICGNGVNEKMDTDAWTVMMGIICIKCGLFGDFFREILGKW